ncbi:serine hydrolase [Nocardia sp. BMG111209]|uniref:serine hydrolase domain-containing protein n=1 Tax=Nocardia sp. BMG111209 TaxID=1160137 RepID=UPI00037B84F8|nr:serine hydrolase domain-containing protein [Nocardia sp. BMG111209]
MSTPAVSATALPEFVAATATRLGIPGAAVGVWADGRETFACHGVTSVENPLPVDPHTLFTLGSVSKTFTATVVMHLVTAGLIELDAPVRRYVPELILADERAAAEMTVRNLLNHTAGLGIRLIVETGDGDDALAAYVGRMRELEMIGAVGDRASYSQAGYNLLGRIVEKVTGGTFEQTVTDLALEPLGLRDTCYRPAEAMVKRFAVGHNPDGNGGVVVARQWKDTRGNNPGGGIASTVTDQLRWARLHLGDLDDAAARGVLPLEVRRRMQQPTVALRGSSLGDAFGLCWFLRAVGSEGVHTVGHGGSGNGQFADLLLVPERNFAVTVMCSGPDGVAFTRAVTRWALEHYLGVVDRDPEPIPFDGDRARELVGHYATEVMTLTVRTTADGMALETRLKPEIRATSKTELPADYPPFDFGLLPGDGDDYIVTGGAFTGQRGFFTRDSAGTVVGIDLAGRLFTRVAD